MFLLHGVRYLIRGVCHTSGVAVLGAIRQVVLTDTAEGVRSEIAVCLRSPIIRSEYF